MIRGRGGSLALALGLFTTTENPIQGKPIPPVYANRPFVTIAHSLEFLPGIGFSNEFASAQLAVHSVFFLPTLNGHPGSAVLKDAGAEVEPVLSIPRLPSRPDETGIGRLTEFRREALGNDFAIGLNHPDTAAQLFSLQGDSEPTRCPGALPSTPSETQPGRAGVLRGRLGILYAMGTPGQVRVRYSGG